MFSLIYSEKRGIYGKKVIGGLSEFLPFLTSFSISLFYFSNIVLHKSVLMLLMIQSFSCSIYDDDDDDNNNDNNNNTSCG